MKLIDYRAAVGLSLLVAACTPSKYPERPLLLTPANELGDSIGTIKGRSTPLGPQSGFVVLKTPQGEEFSGTYALLETPDKEAWRVILTSDAGMQMLCTYAVDDERKHGSGQCKTAEGAEYNLSF